MKSLFKSPGLRAFRISFEELSYTSCGVIHSGGFCFEAFRKVGIGGRRNSLWFGWDCKVTSITDVLASGERLLSEPYREVFLIILRAAVPESERFG